MDAFSLRPDELPDLTIDTFGVPKMDSPLKEGGNGFVDDSEKVILYTHSEDLKTSNDYPTTVEKNLRCSRGQDRAGIYSLSRKS